MPTSIALAAAALLGFAALPALGQSLPGSGALPLRAAVEIALVNSAQLQAAGADVRISEQQVREAYSGVYPQISAEASYLRSLGAKERVVDGGGANPQWQGATGTVDNSWSASLKLNQTVLDFRVFSGLEAARGLRGLRGEELRGAAQQVVASVRQRYFDALLTQEQERLTEQGITRLQQILSETRARHREGFASDNEMLRLEVQLANLESNLLRVRNQVAAAKGALLVTMGADPLQEVELQGTLSELQLGAEADNSAVNADLLAVSGAATLGAYDEEELRRTAMSARSDLRQLRTLTGLGELQLEIQRAEYLPTIRAFASLDFSAGDDDDDGAFGRRQQFQQPTLESTPADSSSEHKHRIKTVPSTSYSQFRVSGSAGLSVQVQLFSGFARDARAAQRREELLQTTARLRQAEREMLNQVHTLSAARAGARARAASQQRAIEQAQQSYQIATARYREGVGSQLDVTAAESTLRESQFNYAQAVYDYLSAASQLEVAIGQVPLADGVRAAATG